MTKEEAIYLLRNTAWLAPSLEPVEEAVEMAIDALCNAFPTHECIGSTHERVELISREAALDILDDFQKDIENGVDSYGEHRDMLLSLPGPVGNSEQLEWIPCSERLPETEISVLIWLPSHWNKNGGTIEIGFLDEDNEWNWLAESMSGYYEIVEGVSAWMPLPDVWEGDGNNEKVRRD